MYIVSACLLGVKCRYDGETNLLPVMEELLLRGCAIPVCPEQLGGLSTPRRPVELVGGDGRQVLIGSAKAMTVDGKDVSRQFIAGAKEVLKLALKSGSEAAILKNGSPSCGCTRIYDGSFSGKKIPGMGVTAAILAQAGITVYSEENYHKNGGCK